MMIQLPNDARIKFSENGEALPYYGNTVVSFVTAPDSPVYQTAVALQEEIRRSPIVDCLAFLPASSFHMTVLGLCREIDRNTSAWPPYLSNKVKFKEVDQAVHKKVQEVPFPDAVRMRMTRANENHIVMEPARECDNIALKSYRDTVSEITGTRQVWHDIFFYHVTLSYTFKEIGPERLAEQEQLRTRLNQIIAANNSEVSVPSPQFVIFNDMLSYEPDLSKRGDLY